MCVYGKRCGGNGPFARKVYVSVGAGKAVPGEVGEKARQCRGSALGKEGRKYGVGMGENCPFMHETTALKPTMDGVGMGGNCPFMRGKRLLYSIDLLGGGAWKWGKNAPNIEL